MRTTNRQGTALLAIAALALGVRLIYLIQFSDNPAFNLFIHDSALFNHLAQRIQIHGLIQDHAFYIAPLYPYFFALVQTLFNDSLLALRIIQSLLGIGTALCVFKLGEKAMNKITGVIAAIIAATYAPFLFFESQFLGTSLVTFLITASITLLVYVKYSKTGILFAFASGVLFSLAVTGRPNLILVAPVIPAYFILKKPLTSLNIKYTGITLLGLLIPLALTSVHNYLSERNPSPLTTHGGINFYIGNHENADGTWLAPEGFEASVSSINLEESKRIAEEKSETSLSPGQVSKFWTREAFMFIIHHPFQWFGLMGKKFLLFWSSFEIPLNFDYHFYSRFSWYLRIPFFNLIFIMPFAIVGLLLNLPHVKKYWLLYSIIGLGCLSIIMFFVSGRYRIPLMPFLILMAASGMVSIWNIIRQREKRRYAWPVLLILLFVGGTISTYAFVRQSNPANDYYNLSLAHINNENYEQAIIWARRAIDADSSYVNAYYNLGIALMRTQQYEEAMDAFQNVIERSPNDAGGHRNMGALYLVAKEYQTGLQHLEKAVQLDPQNINALINLGLAHYYLGHKDKAMNAWQAVLDIDPDNEQAKNNIRALRRSMFR
jgi:Tfp pilus assembly protein PilF